MNRTYTNDWDTENMEQLVNHFMKKMKVREILKKEMRKN